MGHDDEVRAKLASAVVKKLKASNGTGKRRGPLVLFVNVVQEDASLMAAAAVKRALASLPGGVVFSEMVKTGAVPVPSEQPGDHVHMEQYTLDPRPDLVLEIGEMGGRLCVSAREPGSDPFAPPAAYLWNICEPEKKPG